MDVMLRENPQVIFANYLWAISIIPIIVQEPATEVFTALLTNGFTT